MLVVLLLFLIAFAESRARHPQHWFDLTLCPKNGTAPIRRLTPREWKKCHPVSRSEFETHSTNSTSRKRAAGRAALVPSSEAEWAACPHKREDALPYLFKYADLNNDGLICYEEISKLKSDMLLWYEKLALIFAQPDQIMKRCAGKDGYISRADFKHYNATCLRNCDSMNDFFEYFVNRAIAQNYKPTPVECSAKMTPELIAEVEAYRKEQAKH